VKNLGPNGVVLIRVGDVRTPRLLCKIMVMVMVIWEIIQLKVYPTIVTCVTIGMNVWKNRGEIVIMGMIRGSFIGQTEIIDQS